MTKDDQADIKRTLRTLAATAFDLIPHKVSISRPDRSDAEGLISDLMRIARAVDAVIEAYGEYAQSTLGMSQRDLNENFKEQLEKALDGNATFSIEQAIEDLEQSRADRHADLARMIEAAE